MNLGTVLNVQKLALNYFQKRNTFILRRKYEPPLKKAGANPRKGLKGKHFIYELVEDTSLRKEEKIDVVLTQYVENVGRKGDVISMKKNAAYNKLLLPGFAEYAKFSKIQTNESTDHSEGYSSPYAQRTMNILKSLKIAVVMNKDMPWAIEPWHLRVSLRKLGIHCKDDCIKLIDPPLEGPNLDIQNKTFLARITINNTEEVDVKFCIHHWSTDPKDRLPYVFEHWKQND